MAALHSTLQLMQIAITPRALRWCRVRRATVSEFLKAAVSAEAKHLLLAKAFREGQLTKAMSMLSQLPVSVNMQVCLLRCQPLHPPLSLAPGHRNTRQGATLGLSGSNI